MTNPQPILSETKLYSAWDRIVCGRVTCAGSTAVYTGRTIGGARVYPLTKTEAAEHRAAGFDVTCECGAIMSKG